MCVCVRVCTCVSMHACMRLYVCKKKGGGGILKNTYCNVGEIR